MLDEIKQKDLLIWAMREADEIGEQGECELPEDEIALATVTDAFAEQMRDHVVEWIDDGALVEFFDWEELDGGDLEKKITEEARAYCYDLDYSEIAEFWATVAIESIKYGDF